MIRRCFKLVLLAGACFAAMQYAAAKTADAPRGESLSDDISDRIVSVSQGWGEIGVNTSAAAVGQQPLKLRIKDKQYAHGLGHHANGEITVDLGRQFNTFQTEIGVQWQGGQTPASVVFQIYVDGKKVFDSGVMHENDAPRPVTVSVEGAKELRLAVTDAGDGINYDAADWAEARLIRNPAAAKERPQTAIDVAPFGIVVSWDPKVMTGTKANRVQEFPAEDIAPYKEILPVDGVYSVPVTNGQACIGLQWLENRLLRQIVLQFPGKADVPAAGSVQLQYWVGGSAWQGGWQREEITPKKVDNSLVWSFGLKQIPRGTQKVRWVFADVKQAIALAGISAFTRSRCETIDIRMEATHYISPSATVDLDTDVTQLDWAPKADIDLYNGDLLAPKKKSPRHCTWDRSKPLTLKVRYAVPQRYKADRTVLRFQMKGAEAGLPGRAFGVAIEDLLANDCVYVPHAGVFVTRLPAPVTLADYLKKIAGQETVLQQVRQKPDQDFARAWSVVHNPVQDLGPMMISLANDNRKYIALREGGILFDEFDRPDDPHAADPGNIYQLDFRLPWRCIPTFGSGQNTKITRELLGDWLPIPATKLRDGTVAYQQIAFVVPMSPATADAPFWYRDRAMCVADYHVRNDGSEPTPAKLTLTIASDNKKPFRLQDVKEGVLAVEGERVLALIVSDGPSPLTMKRESDGVVLSGSLPAGAAAHCIVCLPAWKVAPKDYASLIGGKGLLSQVESYWETLLKPAMQIDVPDALLTNIIRASQVHCMLAARNLNRGARISAWASADRYGALESESNSVIRGMDMNGQTDFAQRSLDYFLNMCNKQGFITAGYTLVGTGEILWNLGEHYDRTHDRVWMKKIAPEVVRICQWVIRQREKTKRLDAHGRTAPEYGLMPPGVTADWDRFAYRLFNDTQYYAGLEAAARALADVGDPAAAAIVEDAKRYREDILRAYRWVQARTPVLPLDNGQWVPGDPAFMDCFGHVEDFLPSEDGDRTWCYSIEVGAHQMAATNVLDPVSADVNWITDYLEDVQFLRTGMGDYPEASNRKDVFCFGGFAKLQPYYCRIAEVYAMRDDVKPFVRSYFNCIPTLVSRENLSFWEHFHNQCGWNKTHETGWFLCQTRVMFVGERGDELWLAPFVTNHWLKDGQRVSVRNAPTRFGKVGYTITSHVAKGEIEAVVELPEKCAAKKVVLRLRHPEGKLIQSVTVQGEPHKGFDPKKETISFEPSGQSVTIRAKY